MKRFQLFGFDTYYPGGGGNDICAEASSVNELMASYKRKGQRRCDSYQVLDMKARRWLSDEEVSSALQRHGI